MAFFVPNFEKIRRVIRAYFGAYLTLKKYAFWGVFRVFSLKNESHNSLKNNYLQQFAKLEIVILSQARLPIPPPRQHREVGGFLWGLQARILVCCSWFLVLSS
ncbi:MAG: hypothetical protein ACK46A_02175 [Akkermansiaceae bacterium]|jgi:hypothetical protein